MEQWIKNGWVDNKCMDIIISKNVYRAGKKRIKKNIFN